MTDFINEVANQLGGFLPGILPVVGPAVTIGLAILAIRFGWRIIRSLAK
jgi:hypothetical protein